MNNWGRPEIRGRLQTYNKEDRSNSYNT